MGHSWEKGTSHLGHHPQGKGERKERDGSKDHSIILNTALGAQSVCRKGTWRIKSIAHKGKLPSSTSVGSLLAHV